MEDVKEDVHASVVLCTYTEDMYPHFSEAAESILSQTYDDVELVVIVDGTQSVYDRVVADYGDREDVVIECNEENVGLLESRNRGAEIATGDVVAFIDDDAVADEQWIERLVRAYEEEDAIAAGGKMTPEWVAGKPSFLPEEFYWLVGVTHRGFAEEPGEVRNTFGSNISFRAEVFEELGGFDVDIGGRKGEKNLQGGETELCARIRTEYGQGVWYDPEAKVAHKVFEYRTEFQWLMDRAFWQGYSKRAMETILSESGDEEANFARRLLTEFVPTRLNNLIRSPSLNGFLQFMGMFIFALLVGAGYLYGMTRYGGTTAQADTKRAEDACQVLWLRPDKSDNVSVGRHRIADELRELGYEVEIWNTDLRGFRDVLSVDPDVVIGTTRLGALVGTWKKLVHGTPLVVDHIDPISQLRRNSSCAQTLVIAQLEKVAFIFADHVLVVYEEELSRVERYASGVTKTKLGVDYETFADPPEKILNRARAILGEKTRVDAKTIIYVGGLEPPYHIPTVIEAMDHLDGWQFVVLGDGEQRDIVEQADSNRADVFYLGTVDHELIPGFLHESDVGISLVDDRNTLKLLEYGAARLPTVNVEGDAEAKFDGLVEFCSLNPTDVARGIENAGGDTRIDAFQEFTEGFGWAAIATEYEKALCSAVPDVKESNTPPDDR